MIENKYFLCEINLFHYYSYWFIYVLLWDSLILIYLLQFKLTKRNYELHPQTWSAEQQSTCVAWIKSLFPISQIVTKLLNKTTTWRWQFGVMARILWLTKEGISLNRSVYNNDIDLLCMSLQWRSGESSRNKKKKKETDKYYTVNWENTNTKFDFGFWSLAWKKQMDNLSYRVIYLH